MLITKKYLLALAAIAVLAFLGGCSGKQAENIDFEKNYLEDLSEENSKQPGAGFMVEP